MQETITFFVLLGAVFGAVSAFLSILTWFGFKGQSVAKTWRIMPSSIKGKLITMLFLVALSLSLATYGFLRAIRPKIVEKEKIVEKLVPTDCPISRSEKPSSKNSHGAKEIAAPAKPTAQPTPGITLKDSPGSAVSYGQQGGVTAGTINLGPPPIQFRWRQERVTSSKPQLPYETKIAIFPSDNYTPVSLAIFCDVDVDKDEVQFDFGPNGSVIAGRDSGVTRDSNKIAYVKFGGTAMSPDVPLYVHL